MTGKGGRESEGAETFGLIIKTAFPEHLCRTGDSAEGLMDLILSQ